jgi:hypothetical protein
MTSIELFLIVLSACLTSAGLILGGARLIRFIGSRRFGGPHEARYSLNPYQDILEMVDLQMIPLDDLARGILSYAMGLLSPIHGDPSGIADDAQLETIHRCGEAIVIAGTYTDRSREQLIDAYKYLKEIEVEYSK